MGTGDVEVRTDQNDRGGDWAATQLAYFVIPCLIEDGSDTAIFEDGSGAVGWVPRLGMDGL